MNKTYNPKEFEQNLYNEWLKKGYFGAKPDKTKKPFCIIMPPPNVTNKLHIGHAFQETIQDILIRRKRKQGYSALWVPGADHAALSTESMIVKMLKENGQTKEGLGREKFKQITEDWYKKYMGLITNQFKKMGFSCDFDRFTFTMDERNNRAVRKVFVDLYRKGWIYRGQRIINWCVGCKSSISDAEVDFKEIKGHFYHLKYKLKGSDDFVVVATTRPETMLGDTAVAVNPTDKRYKNLVGKSVVLPLVGRVIPIISDSFVDKEFGTGVVKITPAHDPNDFEAGKRHNLEIINILTADGRINENGGKYKGLSREEARAQIVKDLKNEGTLVKIEEHIHSVGHCERCKVPIEPLASDQWFVKMKDLAKPAIDVVKDGEVRFSEEQHKKTYLNWMENLQDWCISRQIWNGHRIPIFRCSKCGEIIVEYADPKACPKCGSVKLTQDEDTLDTWFSSALWPLSTLGFPDETEDLKYFYPTDVMVTGKEIINLWVARMIFDGLQFRGQVPFRNVLINGLGLDENGIKMSKTLGNGVDPIDVIDEFGADTLRFSMFSGMSVGSNFRFSNKRVEITRNFMNKIWNAGQFVLSKLEKAPILDGIADIYDGQDFADKWITVKLNELIGLVDQKFEKFDIGLASVELYDFFRNIFCDYYIEFNKCENKQFNFVLYKTFRQLLSLLHPYVPFITEEIYQNLLKFGDKDPTLAKMGDKDYEKNQSIVTSEWPVADLDKSDKNSLTKDIFKKARDMDEIIEIIKAIRNVRAEKQIPDNKKIKAAILPIKDKEVFEEGAKYITKLALLNELEFVKEPPADCITLVFERVKIFLPLSGFTDKTEQEAKLKKEIEDIIFEIERSEKMLGNQGFVAKAPEVLIKAEKEKLEKNKTHRKVLEETLNSL
ncbi:MAG: valine--tRNA ligase [Christensenellaceae bacterium]|jgi:valyl-tRNA synthetase|nr:valine--tRNA ligase [Christensenellaceae bacterium]